MEKIKATIKWARSFSKKDWDLEDYPIRVTRQHEGEADIPEWSAQIINWWALTGLGNTKAEALAELRVSLSKARESREKLPRPGAKVPIDFASGDKLDSNWEIVSRIIQEVLGYEPEDVFVSDESSLWDFAGDEGIEGYQKKIREAFGVDISHLEAANLADIASAIALNG